MASAPWSVLVLGGASGCGKTTAAERIGQRLGRPWLQVDDLRLAAQYGVPLASAARAELRFFLDTPNVWRLSPLALRDRLIAIGEAMIPAVEVVVEHHLATDKPLIIEGDGILPALFTRPTLRDHVAAGRVRGVFIGEGSADALAANLRARRRRDLPPPGEDATAADAALLTQAQMNYHYGEWLREEAQRRGLPVVATRLWHRLTTRILTAAAE